MITENKLVQGGLSALPDIFTHTTFFRFEENEKGTDQYRPLVLASFSLEISLFGHNPRGHHVLQVFYYTLLCLLLYRLLERFILKDRNKLLSLAITLLFLVHPLHTEVVSNIKSRDEILCFLFFIISAITFFKSLQTVNGKEQFFYRLLSGIAFFASLLSKETAISLILVFPMLAWFFGPAENSRPSVLLRLTILPMLFLCLYMVIRLWVLSGVPEGDILPVSELNNALISYGYPERLLFTFHVLLLYLKLLIFPHPLVWDYSLGHFTYSPLMVITGLLSLAIHLLLLWFAIYGLKRRSVFSFCILFYFLSLSLTSNVLMPISSTMGERFLFIPSLSFCISFVLLTGKLFREDFLPSGSIPSRYFLIVTGTILLTFSIKSFSRSLDWKDEQTLIINDFKYSHSIRSVTSYCDEKMRMISEGGLSRDHYLKLGKEIDEAIARFPDHPEKSQLWFKRGLVHQAANNLDLAIFSFEQALSYKPGYTDALHNLAVSFQLKGQFNKAFEIYHRILKVEPNHFQTLRNLGTLWHNAGKYTTAIYYYKKALEINPGDMTVKAYLHDAAVHSGAKDSEP
ncbi:MAG: tetratricopeptide repeat protein [Bacteroidales bacterium]